MQFLIGIFVFFGFVVTAAASPNCFSSQIQDWIGYKNLNNEELKQIELRLDRICKAIQSDSNVMAGGEILARASVLKLGACDVHPPDVSPLDDHSSEDEKMSFEDEKVQIFVSRLIESTRLFCANTRYEDLKSLLTEYKNHIQRLNILNVDLFCLDAAHKINPEMEGWQGILFSIVDYYHLPSVSEVREKAKTICQELRLNKISLDQANKLLETELMFKKPEMAQDFTNSLIKKVQTSLEAPFKHFFELLAWLVGIGGGLAGLILTIKKLMDSKN